jgi:hypothetical protein
MSKDTADYTPAFKVRMPRAMWEAYGRICERLGIDRTGDLLDHVRRQIDQHGDERDRTDLAAADAELAERRRRKGGRPRKATTDNGGAGTPPVPSEFRQMPGTARN